MNTNEYVAELIPGPNSLQPNFIAWLSNFIQLNVDTQDVLNGFPDDFDIEVATGDQLDILGEVLGVSRQVNFIPGGGASSILSDTLYRVVLKAKIIFNQWKGTKDEIYDFWQLYFPEYPILIQDNQDMTMSVLVIGMPNDLSGADIFGYDEEDVAGPDGSTIMGWDEGYWEPFSSLFRDLVNNNYFVPKPAGVAVSYAFYDGIAFGFDIESDFVKGWDQGEFIEFN